MIKQSCAEWYRRVSGTRARAWTRLHRGREAKSGRRHVILVVHVIPLHEPYTLRLAPRENLLRVTSSIAYKGVLYDQTVANSRARARACVMNEKKTTSREDSTNARGDASIAQTHM